VYVNNVINRNYTFVDQGIDVFVYVNNVINRTNNIPVVQGIEGHSVKDVVLV
jgi:hypothetical protein